MTNEEEGLPLPDAWGTLRRAIGSLSDEGTTAAPGTSLIRLPRPKAPRTISQFSTIDQSILALAEDGSLWILGEKSEVWHQLPLLPDRVLE